MTYNTETQRVSSQDVNSSFLEKLASGDTKSASNVGTTFIRKKMRESSFTREIIPPILLTDDEIDRDERTDLPKKIVEMEPDSVATFVPFHGTGRRSWFSGPRYAVYIGKIESQHFMKSKFELMTYENDIRKILSDNSVKDMADQEDLRFYETLNAITTQRPGQVLATTGGLTAANVVSGVQLLVQNKIPMGKLLMTESLYMDALKLPATSIGDQAASEQYHEGHNKKTLWGYEVVTTIKNDILPDNEMFVFGPSNYLGNFFMVQDATLYIKQEADMLEFWSYEALGIGIGNSSAVIKVTF